MKLAIPFTRPRSGVTGNANRPAEVDISLQNGLNLSTKIAFGVGGIANGVKLRAVAAYLLVFYNQVIGLDAVSVSTVILISLIFDAIFDPLIGQWSDNLRSRWGRRHPFMYASAVPYALFFAMLWNPPDWSSGGLVAYLLFVLVGLRLFDTFFELPTLALGPEITKDYDERTNITIIRALCGTLGTLAFAVLTLNVLLKENSDGTGGILARNGYTLFGICGGIIIFTVILWCSIGTHGQIKNLHHADEKQRSFKEQFRDFSVILKNRSFLSVAVGGLLAAAAIGIAQTLDIYWNLYVFGLSQSEIGFVAIGVVVAFIFGSVIVPRVSSRIGKRNSALVLFTFWLLLNLAPLILVISGMVDKEHAFVFVLPCISLSTTLSGFAMVMMTSMLMDVAEEVEFATDRRMEGVLFSVESLIKKVTSGVGVLISGAILSAVEFPRGAERESVPDETLREMALIYIPTHLGLFLACLIAISFYTLTREAHGEILNGLERKRAQRKGKA